MTSWRFAACSYLALGRGIEETATIVREAGYSGIEWRLHDDGQIRPGSLEDDLRAARRAQEANGLTSVCLTSYAPILDADAAERDIRAAAALETRRVRLMWPPYDASQHAADVFDDARWAMDGLVPLLEETGVTVVFETHRGSIYPTASAAKRLVDPYPPHLYSVLYDPPNTVSSGMEDVRYAIDILGEHLTHVQFKNVGWIRDGDLWRWTWMALGEGMIDWRQVLGHLRLRGWDDWLSNENFLLIPPERRPGLGTVYEGMPSWLADVDRPLVERLRADRELIEQLSG